MKSLFSVFIFIIGFILCLTGKPCRADQLGGISETPIIRTSYGAVRGQKFLSSWTNKTIYSFKGIPYAAPPVGELRFQDPVTSTKWSDVRDGTRERAVCPQSRKIPNSVQSEDCLYLNVYLPKMPSKGRQLLPVMVYIYGGAFYNNSGNYDARGPDFLVAEGIIYVSFNYRLGALGFLNLGIPGAPGNAGLKDQRFALLWVQSEIHNFGGDPRQVTIFGQSAGAMSCHLHYISPLSVGLFHRMIGNSGSAIGYHNGVRADGAVYGLMLAGLLNCNVSSKWRKDRDYGPSCNGTHPLPGTDVPYIDPEVATTALKCLMAADYQDIVRAQAQVTDFESDITGLNIFGPTIDKNNSKEPFLPDFPFKLLENKKKFFVPSLMGINSDEGITTLTVYSENQIRNITNNLEYIYALQVPQSCCGKIKAEKLKNFYFKNTQPSELNIAGFVDMYSDVWYGYGTAVTARHYQAGSDVFLYYFSFNGKFKDTSSLTAQVQSQYNYTGVSHAEELNYLFVVKGVNQTSSYYSNEMKTLRRMVKMWTNFVKYGKPTVKRDPLLQNVQWLPARGGRTNHLQIDVNLRMTSQDLLACRYGLWDSITFRYCY